MIQSKIKLVIIRGVILLIAFMPLAHAGSLSDLNCPNPNNPEEIQKWRDLLATQDFADSNQLVETIEKCFARDKIPLCVQRVHGYHEMQLNGGSKRIVTSEEFNIRRPPSVFPRVDKKIEGTEDYSTTVKWFQHDPAKGIPYKDAEQIAKENGWPVARYKSRHSGGFDRGTSNLIMIHVPGAKLDPPKDYDQYINIAVPADPEDLQGIATKDVKPIPSAKIPTPDDYNREANGSGPSLPEVVTIVSVKKAGKGFPAKVWFDKYNRKYGTAEFERERNPNVLNGCYSCHPNGLRAISPLGYHVDAAGQQRGQVMSEEMWKIVRDMDSSMNLNLGFKVPDLGSFKDSNGKIRPVVNFQGSGPVYGPVRPLTRNWVGEGEQGRVEYPTRSEDFIKKCSKKDDRIAVTDIFQRAAGRDNVYKWDNSLSYDWKKVRKAMNCASCHDGVNRGTLNSRTPISTINYKILVDQSMPIGFHRNPLDQGAADRPVTDMLNPNERIALANCLEAEFSLEQNKNKEWMSELSCSTNKPIPPGPHLRGISGNSSENTTGSSGVSGPANRAD